MMVCHLVLCLLTGGALCVTEVDFLLPVCNMSKTLAALRMFQPVLTYGCTYDEKGSMGECLALLNA